MGVGKPDDIVGLSSAASICSIGVLPTLQPDRSSLHGGRADQHPQRAFR
jgi:hypothetical protein